MPQLLPKHFSEILLECFQKKAIANPSYSMRAFARDLDLSSGQLSEIIQKQVGISQSKASDLADKLQLTGDEKDFFCKLVKTNCAKSEEEKEKSEKDLFKYQTSYTEMSDDFECIYSHWYHLAIAELVSLPDFQYDFDWISKRIKIHPLQAKEALTRLLSVKLLEEREGRLFQNYNYVISPSGLPSRAARCFHKELLHKASVAIDEQQIEERDCTSGFLHIRKKDLPKAANRIKEFRRELVKELESGEEHDSVYAFAIQLFQIDTK